ncbi:MAG: hypothetical protein CMJ39_08820 [Phycisphaerae bacterium]|nr:hypothetical protein [Phycisphaerae bacterium]
MHVLKKVGTTLLAGGVVGTFATAALGTSELLTVGDYGNYSQSSPDGNSDRIVWDSVEGTVTFVYTDGTGLNVLDSSGELVAVVASGTNGTNSGYGRNATTTYNFGETNPFAAPDGNPVGWWAPATIDDNATAYGGFGATARYYIDGPAGSYIYNGRNAGDAHSADNLTISSGGTGYMPGAQNATWGANSLLVEISAPLAGDIGSFGFAVGAGGNATTDNINAVVNQAGVRQNVTGTSTRMWITGDASNGTAGNWRLFLGHTPVASNNTAVVGAASAAGQVANLDIRANSNVTAVTTSGIGYTAGNFMIYDADGNLVDGVVISYNTDDAGRIYTGAAGSTVSGTNNTNGLANDTSADNWNSSAGWTITQNNASGLTSSAGWTVVPQGNGFGFDCRGVHLYGQVVALQAMSTWYNDAVGPSATNGTSSFPEVTITLGANSNAEAATVGTNGSAVVFATGAIPTGAVIGGHVEDGGQNYSSAPDITVDAGDSGDGAVLTGILGGVGNRQVSTSDGTVVTGLAAGYTCYANGDFNGDGNSDLVWRSADYGLAIWNMGADARIESAGFITDPGADWQLITLGKMGYDGVGCCMFWYNTSTGQTAVWAVNSTDADPANWILGGAFLDTVDNLNYTPRCGNNVVQNGGSAVYWQDGAAGNVAYWPVSMSANASSASNSGAGELTFEGATIAATGYNVAGVGNMNGRPVGDGASVLRDVALTGADGTTAVWTMDSDWTTCLSGAFTTFAGVITEQGYEFAGVGQYANNVTYTRNAAVGVIDGGTRLQWMYNMMWSSPGAGTSFTWMMDRNIQLQDIDAEGAVTGSGLLTNNAAVVGTGAVTFND